MELTRWPGRRLAGLYATPVVRGRTLVATAFLASSVLAFTLAGESIFGSSRPPIGSAKAAALVRRAMGAWDSVGLIPRGDIRPWELDDYRAEDLAAGEEAACPNDKSAGPKIKQIGIDGASWWTSWFVVGYSSAPLAACISVSGVDVEGDYFWPQTSHWIGNPVYPDGPKAFKHKKPVAEGQPGYLPIGAPACIQFSWGGN